MRVCRARQTDIVRPLVEFGFPEQMGMTANSPAFDQIEGQSPKSFDANLGGNATDLRLTR